MSMLFIGYKSFWVDDAIGRGHMCEKYLTVKLKWFIRITIILIMLLILDHLGA